MHTNGHECEDLRALDGLAESVIGCAYEVQNVFGCGFLEKVYERALIRELRLRGVEVKSQVPFPVAYKGQHVGDYIADMVVAGSILVELKCVEEFAPEHVAQCINYLKASHLRLALLFNFQNPKVQWRRIVL